MSREILTSVVQVPRSSDILADAIRSQVVSGQLTHGEQLPTERDLMKQSGLSRGSVREALRILELEGFIRTRPGRYGGAFVHRPSEKELARALSTFAQGNRVTVHHIVTTRAAIAPTLAQLAAENRTEEELEALERATEDMRRSFHDVPRFLQHNSAWYSALAVASHNILLEAFLASISTLIDRSLRLNSMASDDTRSLAMLAHRRIEEAIRASDGPAARRRMERHIEAYSRHLLDLVTASSTLNFPSSE